MSTSISATPTTTQRRGIVGELVELGSWFVGR
jgi:hypothetical protein